MALSDYSFHLPEIQNGAGKPENITISEIHAIAASITQQMSFRSTVIPTSPRRGGHFEFRMSAARPMSNKLTNIHTNFIIP